MEPIIIALIAALLPVLLLLFYIYHQDSKQPEPIKWLWKGVVYGVASALLVIFIMYGMPDVADVFPDFQGTIIGAVLDAFLSAAIPEEGAKLLMLWLLLRKNPYFDEHLDGIVYATCVGLGFAGLENILYIVNNMDDMAYIAVMRGLFSVPGHFFFAVSMGYFVSLAHFSSRSESERTQYYVLAFIVPVILHGIFDSLLFDTDSNSIFSSISWILFIVFVHYMRKGGITRIMELKDK